MDKKFQNNIWLFIFIGLLLILGAYYLSKNLNKSLSSTKTPPIPTTLPPNPPITSAPNPPITSAPNPPITSAPIPRPPKGTTGSLCVTVNEGDQLNINAPDNTHFTQLLFADYGQPYKCPQYGQNSMCSAVQKLKGPGSYDDFPFMGIYFGFNDPSNPRSGLKQIDNAKQLSTAVNNNTMYSYGDLDPCPGQAKWFTAVIQYVWE
jgi:hypothetical protein